MDARLHTHILACINFYLPNDVSIILLRDLLLKVQEVRQVHPIISGELHHHVIVLGRDLILLRGGNCEELLNELVSHF
jgi:hypothetical protein